MTISVSTALQLADAGFGHAHAAMAFEVERLGDDADGQDAHVAGALGDAGQHRCRCRRPCRR
jgi:hypothetical protein